MLPVLAGTEAKGKHLNKRNERLDFRVRSGFHHFRLNNKKGKKGVF